MQDIECRNASFSAFNCALGRKTKRNNCREKKTRREKIASTSALFYPLFFQHWNRAQMKTQEKHNNKQIYAKWQNCSMKSFNDQVHLPIIDLVSIDVTQTISHTNRFQFAAYLLFGEWNGKPGVRGLRKPTDEMVFSRCAVFFSPFACLADGSQVHWFQRNLSSSVVSADCITHAAAVFIVPPRARRVPLSHRLPHNLIRSFRY